MNEGFKNNIVDILESINGTHRVYSNTKQLTDDDYKSLSVKFPNTVISRFKEQNCIIKFSKNSEGIILNTINNIDSKKHNITRFITSGYYSDSTIVIGELLKSKLDINLYDEVFLISFDGNEFDKVSKSIVSGFFKTNIPDYDKHMVFSSTRSSNYDIFGQLLFYSYFRLDSSKDSINISSHEYKILDSYNMNKSFYLWLNTYDNPIKILVLFLFIISLLNIINNSYYLVYYKKSQINTLLILGLDKYHLKNIIILRSVVLSSISAIFGLLIGYLLLVIESVMHLVKLPSNIYFIDYIPISIQYNFLLVILFYIFSVSFVSTFFNFNIHSK